MPIPALLQPFEEANGVKVNVKEFEGTGAGLAIVEQSQPGDWDVMVIDSIDVPRGVEKGLFEPLPEDKLPFADLFPEVKMDGSTKVDGKRYGITEKFGYNTIGFNKDKVDPADMQSMAALTGDKYKGRIAIYDYYLPVIGMAALAIGKKTAGADRSRPAGDQGRAAQDEGQRQAGRRGDRQPDRARHRRGRHPGRRRRMGDGGPRQGEPGARFLDPEGRRRAVVAVARHVQGLQEQGPGAEIHPVRAEPRGPGAACHLVLLLGHAGQHQGGADRRAEEDLRFDEQPGFLARAQPYPAPDADLDKKMQDVWTEMLQAQ